MGQPVNKVAIKAVKLKLNSTHDLRLRLINLSFMLFSTAVIATSSINAETESQMVSMSGIRAGITR